MEYTITVTEEELGVVARALMELPYKMVANLFTKLNQQVTEQQQATQAPVEEAPAEPQEQPAPAETE